MSVEILPSFYGVPIVTSLPTVRYDERGRLMKYNETEMQRREREAFVYKKQLQQKISAWVDSQQRQTKKVTFKRAAWTLSDPLDIGFIAMSVVLDISRDAQYSPENIVYSTPLPPTTNSLESLTEFRSGHRRQSSSLSSIPEED
ncbi:hypothetical protein BDQ17DRAFT_1328045 [Cyathus striatus]|nr:hypothetical protein BDQ17DRAFT_1328045 [Cyathus striatus]